MTATHTPTPWAPYGNKGILSSDGLHIIAHIDGSVVNNDPEDAANREFVLLAVNNHARLVAALRDVMECYDDLALQPQGSEVVQRAVGNTMHKAKALLAEIEKGEA